jgi:lactoylglutathione lyase
MKLNHINLTVSDVPAASKFLETYFGCHSIDGAEPDDKFHVLFDDDHLVITLMMGGKVSEVKYPRTFHIGFGQESEAHVNEIYQRLKDAGFDVAPPQRAHAWTFYAQAPGGFMVEVLC